MTEHEIEHQFRLRQAADHLSDILEDLVDNVDIPALYLDHVNAAQRFYTDAISYEP